ncbi:MAG: DUF4397 domain-containing protein [Crocinitomicaceae bacterium]|jgi:hypothetical protein|nr:DUF4397 domain-containing protein [Crocinitomicaceae bacterium]MDG2463738.1 DUF4397 domain-containing protein [Crocinitomicaceae bacterium]
MKQIKLLVGALSLLLSANAVAQTARVQVIHNSADAAASTVDIWLNSTLLIDDFTFRTASPFIDAPAGTQITIGVAPSNSTMASESIATFPITLTAGETYVVAANGIVSTTGYTPTQAFGLDIYNMGREVASTAGNTDVLVLHGSTDAPTVDVVESSAGSLVNNASYGNFAGYLELPTADYILNVQDMNNTVTVAAYQAPLATLNLTDAALVVVASGFLDPTVNSNGPAFGLWVALPSGGNLIELPSTSGLSLSEKAVNSFVVYPNPTENVIMIQGDNASNASVTVSDIMGKVVLTQTAENRTVDVSRLDAGKYFVTISTLNSIETISIVKK